MLTNEKKLQVFLKLRSENYRDSLRLEGMAQGPIGRKPVNIEPPAVTVKKKHVR